MAKTLFSRPRPQHPLGTYWIPVVFFIIHVRIQDESMKTWGILIVDDDDVVLAMISEWLTQSGYRVFTAEDVHGALKTFKEHRKEIDLLFSDVKLQHETGFDLADALERAYGFQDHVFFTSFFWEEDIVEELLRRGKPYFEKPLKFKQVILPFLERYFREKQDAS